MVVNREEDAIITDPQAVAVHAGKFFHLWPSRLDRKLCDSFKDGVSLVVSGRGRRSLSMRRS